MAAKFQSLRDPSLLIGKNFIGGQWVESISGQRFAVHDPATNEYIGSCPESVAEDAEAAIKAAASAMPLWYKLTGRERSRILRRWYELVVYNREDLATLICRENGKARTDSLGEVDFSASFLEWFAEEAARVYGDVIPHSSRGFRVHVTKEPVGVCGMITPWNFPGAMVTRKVAPALAVGCSVVIKTAGETPFTANAIIALSERAGVPKGVINIVCALNNSPAIGQVFRASTVVRKISFTGSTRVGSLLMAQSSDSLKKLSLELGGNAPFIVFNDASVDIAVQSAIVAKFKVSGQTCVCANRILVQSGIYDEFLRKLVEAVKAFKLGNSADYTVTHGPLINERAAVRVAGLVDDAVAKGATVALGGKRMLSLGTAFFEPTVLTDVSETMRIMDEEIFGPIAAIQKFQTEEEAIVIANNCEVGLASYLFAENAGRIARVSEALHSGMVAVNTGVISDAAAPFGGVKQSGLGREGNKYGVDDYLQLKTVVTGNVSTACRSYI